VSNRDALLEAAKECLRTKGYARTTARDLVAASGTNLSSIGYHFGSKEALLAEAFHDVFEQWTGQLNAAAVSSPAASPLERMAASWRAMLDTLPEHEPLMLAFVESIGPTVRSPELRARLAEHYALTRTEVAAAVRENLGDSDADAETVASFLVAIADGFMIQYLIDPARTPSGEQLVAALGAAFEAAITAAEAAPLVPRAPSE
jgi:AcrR family transcriptional regulator